MVLQRLMLLALVARAATGPVSFTSETCATTCEENGHNFELGQTYTYDFQTTIATSIPDGTEDQSTLQLTAVANIDVLSRCELALRLQEVVLQEGGTTVDKLSEMKTGLEQNTLRFSLGKGLVTGVCPKASEQTWSLNIKRAILSSLQNSMPDFQSTHSTTETDVIGICPVAYEPVTNTWNTYTVKKTKDVSLCSQPTQTNTVFQTMSYDIPSKVKSLPLLKSTHECEQELSVDGYMIKSVCTERHIFRPFSQGDSGATTLVLQSLNFNSKLQMTSTRNQPVSLRTDLQYEHTEDDDIQENTQQEVVATLQKICEVTQDGVHPEVPGLFLDLVKGMRQADLNTLVSIGRQAKRLCSKAESLYHDAVPTLGTSAGVGLMRNMIRGGEVTNKESDIWLTSLAFIPKPDVNMLKEVKPLLTMESIRRKAYLAVSSLVNTYCQQNENCENDVREIITVFQNNLGSDCSGDRSITIMSLKALGNTGITGQVMNVLNNCIANGGISVDVRIAAINAMRRTTCNMDKAGLMEILQSTYTDAELRIDAYIVLMKCPSEELITKVQQILESEEINQVGSFIWTHLTNLMESSSPLKKNIQAILENKELKKAFDLDKRKYSRNIEWSAFSEAMNAGAAVESNLIWSSESFVPRSGMVNLTIDLFGQSVNLVELGGRVHGLDAVLENMFGDKQEGSAMTNNIVENFDSSYRQPKNDPHGSYYIRIFGNEIRYDDFIGFEMQNVKDKLNYLEWLIELAKGHDIDFTKSMIFLESELEVPTVSGMPLVLSVDGTATMDLKIKGKMDLRSLFNSPSELDIAGTVRPSAALEIKSKMRVNAFVAKTGLKMVNTFHTSTLADGLIKLKEGKIFDLDINMPKERMDFFNAQSKFYITYRGEDLEQRMSPEDRLEVHHCIGGSLIRALGVELCADLSVPSLTKSTGPWFPLNGPASAALSLKKQDSFTKYHMEARVVQDMVSQGVFNHEVVFAFNTPGSIYDREFLVNFVLNKQGKTLRLDMRSPWKKLGITGNVIDQVDLKRMTGQLSIDDAVQYALTTEVQITQGKYAMRYIPVVELVLPGRSPYKLSGSATYRENKKLDVDISIENVFKDPAVFKGLIQKVKENKKIRIETDMEVRVNSFKGQMSGFLDHLQTKDEIKTDTELTVRYRTDSRPQFVSLTNQFHFETPTKRKSLLLAGSVSSSLYPRLDTDFSMNMVAEDKEAVLSLSMGLTNDKPKRITFDLQGKADLARYYSSGVVEGLARMNVIGTELEATINHRHNPNELQTSCMGRIGGQRGTLEVNLRQRSARPVNIAGNAKLTYLDHEIIYSQTLVQQGNAYSHEMNIKMDQKEVLALSSTIKTGQRHEVTMNLRMLQWDPLHFEGLIQPDVLNFLGQAKCVYGAKLYSSELQWQHDGGFRNFANKGLLNLVMEDDKFVLRSDVSVQDAKVIKVDMEGEMDIHNLGTRKAGIAGTCVLSRTRPSLQTRVHWWPNSFFDGNIEMKLDNNGLRSPVRKIEGTVNFQSSFMEDISAVIKYSCVPGKVNTEGHISWAPSKKVDLVFGLQKNDGWSDATVNLALNTPFQQATTINTNIAYKLSGNKVMTNGQVGLNNKLITFEMSVTADWKNSALDLKATTPMGGFENIALLIKNNHNGRLYASLVKLDVNSHQIVSMEFNMEHERRGYFIRNSGSLSLLVPIRQYQSNKLMWNHDNDARNFNSRVVVEVRNEKLVIDFELKNRKVFSIKSKLLTPFFPAVYMTLDHESDRREHVYRTSASAQYGDDEITLANDLSVLSRSVLLKTKMITPFTNYEEIVLDISNVLEGNTFEGRHQLIMGTGKEYSLSGIFINNGLPAMTMEIFLKCPHSDDMSLKIANEKQGSIWESKVNALYLQDQSISFVARLGMDDLKKLSVDVSSPYVAMEKASLDFEHQGSMRRFQSKVVLSHNMLTDNVEISAAVDVFNMDDAKIEVNTRTPLHQVSSANAVFTHKFSGEKYLTDARLTLPETQFFASNMLQLKSFRAFTNHATLGYGNEQMNLELQFNAEKDISVSLKQQSSWIGEQTAMFKHEGTWNNFKTSLSASLNPSVVVNAEAEFFLNGNNMDVLMKITTPWQHIQIFEVVSNHHGLITDFENNLKMNYNSQMVLGRIRLDIANFHNMKIEVTAETPVTAFRSILCELKHKLVKQTFQTDFSFISPTKEFVASHTLEMKSKKVFNSKAVLKYQEDVTVEAELIVDLARNIAIDASLHNPWTGEQRLSLVHQGTWTDFQTTITVKPNHSDNIEGHAQFSLSGDRVNSLGRIATPYAKVEHFEIAFSHQGRISNFKTEVKVNLNGESKTGKLVANLQDVNDMNVRLTATTPFNRFEMIDLAITHKYAGDICQTNLAGLFGNHRAAASNMLKVTNSKAFTIKTVATYLDETMVETELSFDAQRNIATDVIFRSKWTGVQTVSLTHHGGWKSFETKVKVSPKHGEMLVFNAGATLHDDNFSGNTKITTSYSSLRIAELTINHQGRLQSFVNNIKVNFNEDVLQGQLSVQVADPNDLSIRLTTTTSFSGFESVSSHITHKFSGHMCQMKFVAEAPLGKVSANNLMQMKSSANFEVKTTFSWMDSEKIQTDLAVNAEDNVAVHAQFQSPWTGKQTLNLEHKGQLTNFLTVVDISPQESDHIVGHAQFSMTRNLVNSLFKINTPYPELEQFEVNLKHQGDISNFETMVNVMLNGQTSNGQLISSFENLNDINVKLAAIIPVPGFERNEVTFLHERSGQTCKTDLLAKVGDSNMAASNTLLITSNKVFSTKTSVTYQEESVAEMELNVAIARTIAVDVAVQSQWSGKQTASLLHQGGWRNFKTTFRVSPRQGEVLNFDAKATVQGYRFNCLARITTPYPSLQTLEVTVNHKGRIQKFTSNIEVTVNDKKLEEELIVNVVNLNDMNVKLTGKTPFSGFENVNGLFKHQFTGNVCQTEMTLEMPEAKISASNLVEMRSSAAFNTKTSLNWMEDKMADIELNVDVESNIAVNGKLQSSWTGTQTASLTHQGLWNNFQTKITVSPRETETTSMDVQVASQGENYSGLLKMISPYTPLESLEVAMSHKGRIPKFINVIEVTVNGEKLEGELSVNLMNMNEMNVKLTGKTPFSGFENVNGLFQHHFSGEVCKTEIALEAPKAMVAALNIIQMRSSSIFNTKTTLSWMQDKVVDFELDVDAVRNVAVRGKLQNTWTGTQTASLKHQGPWNNFQISITISPRLSEEIIGTVQFSMSGDRVSGVTKLTTPYPELDIFEVQLTHQGSTLQFNTEGFIDIKGKRNSIKLGADLSDVNDLTLKVTTVTAFSGFTEADLLLTHQSSGQVLQSDLMLQLESRTYAASNTLRMPNVGAFNMNTIIKLQEEIIGEFQLNLDAINKIAFNTVLYSRWSGKQTASLTHEGHLRNFETKVEVSPKEGEMVTVEAKATLQGYRFSGLTRIQTPYHPLKTLEVAVNHRGRIQKFTNSIEVTFNGERLEGELSVNMVNREKMNVKLTGKTPFSGFENVNGLFQHQFTGQICKTEILLEAPEAKIAASNMIEVRNSAVFRSKTSLNWMQHKMVDFELRVDAVRNVAASAKFQSFWTGTQTASLTHQGPWNNFQTEITVSPRETETVIINTQVSTSENLSGLLKIMTPYTSLKVLDITVAHQGFLQRFSNNVIIKYNDDNFESEVNVDLTNLRDISLKLTGRSSLPEAETFNGHLIHKFGEQQSLSEILFEFPRNKIAARHVMEFHGTFFSSETSGEWMGKTTEMTLRVNTNNGFTLSSSISSPFTGEQSASVTVQGVWNDFETSVSIIPRKSEIIDTKFKFSAVDQVKSSFVITSSYSDWKLSLFSFHHTGTLWKFTSDVSILYNDEKGTAKVSVDLSDCDNVVARIMLETPVEGLESVDIAFEHKQTSQTTNTDFQFESPQNRLVISNVIGLSNRRAISTETSIECSFMEKTALSVNIDIENDISMAAVFTSPWTGEKRITLVHKGQWTNFQTELTVASASQQTVKFDAQFSLDGNIVNGMAKLDTLFPVIRQIELTLTHQGNIFRFENEFVIKYNDELARMASRFALKEAGVDGYFEMVTPFTRLRQVSFTASHDGDLTRFDSKYELDYMGQKTLVTGVYNFQSGTVSGKFELISPYDVMKTTSVEFSHRGQLTNFQNNGRFHLNGKQYSAESVFSVKGPTFHCAAKLRLEQDYSFEMNHDGMLHHFANNVTIHSGNQIFLAESNFKLTRNDMQASVAIQTPFAGWRNLGALYKHNGNWMAFECDLNMNLNQKSITGKHTWKLNDNAILHSLTITTPFQGYSNLKYSLGHQEKRSVIKQNLLLGIEESKLEVKTNFKQTSNKISGNINLRTPFTSANRISVTFLHKLIDVYNFNNELTASLNDRTMAFSSSCSKKNSMFEASFNVDTPFLSISRMNGLFKHTGPLTGFSNEITLSFDDTTMAASTSFRLQGDALSADVTIETPYQSARLLKLQVAHYGSGLNFKNNITGDFNDYHIASATSVMIESGEVKVNVGLQTPFKRYENLASGIHIRKEASAVNSELFIETGRKKSVLRQRLMMRDAQCEGSVTLETPFLGYENMGLRFRHVGSMRNFNSEVTAHTNDRKVQGKTSFKMLGTKVDFKLSLETPLPGLTKAGVTIQHDGYLDNFYNVMLFNVEDKTVDSTNVLSVHTDKVTAEFTLLTPFDELRELKYQLSHSGNLLKFENEMSGTYNTFKSSSTSKFVFQPDKLEASFNAQTPFENIRNVAVSVLHEGKLIPSRSQCVVKVNEMTMSLVHDITFSKTQFDSSLLIETPFTGYKSIGYRANHEGSSVDFQNEFNVFIAASSMHGSSKFTSANGNLDLDAKLMTPFKGFRSMGAMLKQHGVSANFNNEVKVYLEDNAITSVNSLELTEQTFSADFKTETPFNGFRTIGMVIKQNGLSRNFNNEVKMYVEDKAITSVNSLEFEGRALSADFQIETPFEGISTMGVIVKQHGTLKNFNNEIKMYIESKAITSVSSLKLQGRTLAADFNFETPFAGAEMLACKLTHSGHLRNFKNYILVNYNGYKVENRNSFMLYRQKMEASVALDTPLSGFRTLGFSIKCNGRASDFSIEVSANKEDMLFQGQCTSKLTSSSYMMTATLSGPFGNVVTTINHKGSPTNFKNEGSLRYNSNEYKSNMEFQIAANALKLSTSVTMPETYGIVFEHNGPWFGFDNNLHLILADEPHIATSSFKYDGSIDANIKVESTKFPVLLTFNHGGHLKNFKQSSSLSVVGLTYGHTCELMIQGRKISGSFMLNTDHKELHSASVTLNHQGRWNNFENQLTMGLNGDTVTADSQLLIGSKRVKGGIYVRIPDEYSLEFIQKGPKTDMTAIIKLVAANEKSQLSTDFKAKDSVVDGSFDLRSPYIGGKIISVVTFNQNLGTFVASLKTPFENFESLNAEVSHQGTMNNFKTAMKLVTPFHMCQDISFELNHKGHRFNFNESGFLEVDSKKISGDLTFVKNRQGLQTTVSIKTPFLELESCSTRLSHRGSLRDFNTDAVVEWNDQKMEGAVNFKRAKTLQTHAKLATPFEVIREAAFSVNHQGSLRDFTTSSDVSLNGQTVTGTINYLRRGNVLESTGSLTTPFYQMRQGSYQINHRGNLDDFVTSGQVKFDDKVIEGEIIHKLAPEIMTTARLSTPWTAVREVKLNLNHRGHLMDFATIVSGQFNGEVIIGNVALTKTGNKLESSASVRTPFDQFSELAYTYTHDVQTQSVKATATLTLPFKVYKNFRGEFDITGTSNDFRSVLKINTPFQELPEGVVVVSHKYEMDAFTTSGSFTAGSRGIESEVMVQKSKTQKVAVVKVSSPYRVLRDLYFEARNQKNDPEMVTHIEATYNGEKHFDTDFTINTGDLTFAMLNIHAPVNVEIKGRNKRTSKEMSFNVPSVIALTTSYQKEKGKFTQATNLQLGTDVRNKFAYILEGSTAFRNQQASYGGKLNLESRHGSFESSLNHVVNHIRHQYVTEVQVQQLLLSSDITLQNSLKSAFKLSHPSLTRDIVLGLEGSMIDSYRCKINLEYDNQKFEFIGKLTDQSPSYGDTKYIAEAHLTHPASYLDVQFSSQLTNNVERMGGNMEVKYMMTRDRQLRSNALRAEINKIRQELNLEVDTPVKRMSMNGRRLTAGNGRGFAVTGTIDDHDMSADLQLNSDVPGFDVSLKLDPDNSILLSGKYEEPSSLHLEAFRKESGRKIRESEMTVTLNSDNFLNARFFLNPNIYDDMKRLLGFDLGLERMVSDAWELLDEEMRFKKMHLAQALQPLKTAWKEITAPVVSLAMELYDRNDYYVRDMVDKISYWGISVNDYLASLRYQYRQNFAQKFEAMKMGYYEALDQMKYFTDNTVIPYAAFAYVKVMDTLDYIQSHPALENFLNWLQSIDIERHYANFKYYVVDVIVRYNAILDRIDSYWKKLKNIPGMSFIVRSVQGYINALRWVYDVTELDKMVQALMAEVRTQGWQAIVNWWHSKCELVKPHVTRYEPEQGEYEVQMKMPVSWTETSGLPEWPILKHWDRIKKIASRTLADLSKYNFSFANNWAFWDIFYAYKPSSNPLNWIPPFKSHATVAGAQHIMTFDKKFYEFIGECSYLLARDFIDGKFSVLINYDNVNGIMKKKSITVHSGDKELEILSNFKVKVDGREHDLPFKYRHTVIRRIGNIIQLDNDHGLAITCDLAHDRCTVKVNGWYFGKTAGLLGTYDNEPATDFHTADRRHTKSIEDFTLSWSAGSRCRAVNSATRVESSASAEEYPMCAKYFAKQNSPFRLCFGQVEPSSFMAMCMNEVARSTDKNAAACRIASFYVEECNLAYIPLRLPKDCVTCMTPGGVTMQEGQTVTIEKADAPKVSDVVFVVSHKSCNRDVTEKIGNLAKQLTRSFRQSGIADVRFGLVGYGLPGVLNQPHSHTIDGEIFNAGNKIKSVMENFPITDEPTEEDSLAAINFATQYPFRAGASKSVILVPCDSCEEQKMTYPEIQHVLQYHNIHLHLLMNHTFKLRTVATKTAYIFGVDQNGLFTPRTVNDEALTGDQALRRQVLVPKDLCAALSQESDGSIFSITQLLQSRTVVQKKFTDVFTRLVAKKGAPAACQICECVADATGVGINVCRSCAPVNKPWIEDHTNEEPVQPK